MQKSDIWMAGNRNADMNTQFQELQKEVDRFNELIKAEKIVSRDLGIENENIKEDF
jgi:hypothetical protein